MNKRIFLVFVLSLYFTLTGYSIDKRFLYQNYIFVDYINTVEVFKTGNEMNPPVIALNNPAEFLEIHFDDMDGDVKDYQYKIIHCERDWSPSSELFDSDFIDGINQDWITNYDFSRATTVVYTHYNFTFPNEKMQLKISGNYILRIYLDDPEEPIVNIRFFVYEPKALLTDWSVQRTNNPEFYQQKQLLKFKIDVSNCNIQDPYRYFSVIVLQNWRWDDARVFKPFMIQGNIYHYTDDGPTNTFNGLNSFRVVQFPSFRNSYSNIRLMDFFPPFYHVIMRGDSFRANKQYIYTPDIHGRYVIRNVDGLFSPIDADYAVVDFLLLRDKPIAGGSFYVHGGFTNWQFLPQYKMEYNQEKGGYVASILMKQGYYNYYYTFLPDGMLSGNTTIAEGNYSETVNEYVFLIYNRVEGDRYDRLVGAYSNWDPESFDKGKN